MDMRAVSMHSIYRYRYRLSFNEPSLTKTKTHVYKQLTQTKELYAIN